MLKTTAITWNGWNQAAHKVLPQNFWGRHDIEVAHGDVIVTKAGPRHRVGVVVHVTTNPRHLVVSGKMIALRPKTNEVLPRILSDALSLKEPQDYINARTTGMAESQVNFANPVLLNTELLIPPLPEQHRIASVLDTVDAAIANTQAVISKLKQIRAGLLHDLLTRGLDQNGELRDPDRHPEQFKDSPLGRFPIDWQIRTLEEIADAAAPICYGIVQVLGFVPDGVPVLTIGDLLRDYRTNLHRTSRDIDNNYARSRVQPGDVLVSVKGTIGRIGIVPPHFRGNISRDLARIRPSSSVLPEFLFHLLRSPIGQKTLDMAQVGTTRAELSISPLKKLFFVIPGIQEQRQIASTLDAHEKLILESQAELSKMKVLKSGLLMDLLNGRVRVPENTEVTEAAV